MSPASPRKDDVPPDPGPNPGAPPPTPKTPTKPVNVTVSYLMQNIYHWGWFNGD